MHIGELHQQGVHPGRGQALLQGAELVIARWQGVQPAQASIRSQVVFSSVYLSSACRDLSRPLPLCL